MKKRIADIVMDILHENGIKDCFAVVGGGAMHLDNALSMRDDINKYFCHHEQACSMAAEAYARISGKMAAVCVTSGPGGTNAITGVMGSWQDSLPMLVISGQVRYATSIAATGLPLRYRGMQEFDIITSVKNMTNYAVMVTDPLAVRREIQKAIDMALTGRRGPSWVDIPMDIQSAIIEESDMLPPETLAYRPPCASDEDIAYIMAALKDAARPCILAGNGIVNSGNTEAFRAFAAKTNVPVIASCIAGDIMYDEFPMYYGLSGSIGPRTGNFIVQNADLIVSMGSPLGYKMTGFAVEAFAPKAKIIMIDVDENEMKKLSYQLDRFVHSDLTLFYEKIHDMDTAISVPRDWLNYCDMLKSRFTPFEGALGAKGGDRVSAYRFWEVYRDYEPEDSITVLGNNTANTAKLQIGVQKAGQRIVANNNCGSMGADLPETFGAAIASGKQIICSTGDGSIMMNLQELQTLKHYGIPVKIIVFSNGGYAAFRQTCNNFFDSRYIGCTPETGVSFPEFKNVAETFGFAYRLCETNDEIGERLKWLFEQTGPVLLEVLQRFDDPVSPKVMSRLNADGSFSTPALQDMWPFLDQEDYDSLMCW